MRWLQQPFNSEHWESEVQEKEWERGRRKAGGGREGRTGEWWELGVNSWMGVSLSLPDTLPHCVQRGLFLAHILPELLYKKKDREAQFKFLKLTLDGVRLSQEEVRA